MRIVCSWQGKGEVPRGCRGWENQHCRPPKPPTELLHPHYPCPTAFPSASG